MFDTDYEAENLRMESSEHDEFSEERYRQFAKFVPFASARILDVGCSTGRGGLILHELLPEIELWGVDAVSSRIAALPKAYDRGFVSGGTSLDIPSGDVDVVLAGEFLEHLSPHDVDGMICEFQRVLRVGGRVVLTTPNPRSLLLSLKRGTVYAPGHLTQHYAPILRYRLLSHGFSRVRIIGSGKTTRYLPDRTPLLSLFGSYLIKAEKI